ncbi:hypothetical protein N657DRAFT_643834 [Parathielavia appendiculata]|uniref:Uncharacterized protein n=1 Tax=Parathielavia appendiculata TaxID=2587402 RepID=A0AAN6U4N6_9PEZI|nr:hypothetical protein N657DRAFT_643834 [Parathielavia appendiculata]
MSNSNNDQTAVAQPITDNLELQPIDVHSIIEENVMVLGSILQLADDDSTGTLNLEKKRRDDRLW